MSDRQLQELRRLNMETAVRGEGGPAFAILFVILVIAMAAMTHQVLPMKSRTPRSQRPANGPPSPACAPNSLKVLAFHIPWLPHSAVLFIEGMLLSAYLHSKLHVHQGMFASLHSSADIFMQIDGHALLFIFVPVLLFTESLSVDVHLFRRTFWQSFLLACPGVAAGAALSGIVTYYVLPYSWNLGRNHWNSSRNSVATVWLDPSSLNHGTQCRRRKWGRPHAKKDSLLSPR